MKFRLLKVRLNSQGYDSSGSYWGNGFPLYCYESEDGEPRYIRASDREHAKSLVLSAWPDAKFYN